jgi:hypothetical protein
LKLSLGSLPYTNSLCSMCQISCPYSFAYFLRWGVVSPSPNPQLEDHPLSFVHGCLFNIFAANLQQEAIPSIRNLRTCHAVVTRGPT